MNDEKCNKRNGNKRDVPNTKLGKHLLKCAEELLLRCHHFVERHSQTTVLENYTIISSAADVGR